MKKKKLTLAKARRLLEELRDELYDEDEGVPAYCRGCGEYRGPHDDHVSGCLYMLIVKGLK